MASLEVRSPQSLSALDGRSPQRDCSPVALSPAPVSCQLAADPTAAGVVQSPVSVPPEAGPELHSGAGDAPQEGMSGLRPPGKRWRGQRGHRWRQRRYARGALSREALIAQGHPLAPFNTTDFLMEDHDDQPDAELLFDRYGQPTPRESPLAAAGGDDTPLPHGLAPLQPSVARLIAEHIQMEGQVEELESRISQLRRQRRPSSEDGSDDEGARRGEVYMSPETAAKIRVLQTEIRKLEDENAALREGNERLLARGAAEGLSDGERSYTSDSESDSSSSSGSGSSASSRTRSSSSSGSDSSDSSRSGFRSRSPLSPRTPASV